jgi:hypothetical protein
MSRSCLGPMEANPASTKSRSASLPAAVAQWSEVE